MMKKIIFILHIICFTAVIGFGQQGEILLTNKINGKVKIIHEDEKIRIIDKNFTILKGEFHIQTDSMITIGHDTCFINDIIQINRGSGLLGGLLIIGGGLIDVTGFFSLIDGYLNQVILSIPTLLIGTIPIIIGIEIIYKYSPFRKNEWEMKIINNPDLP
jgi:hypothetical protein